MSPNAVPTFRRRFSLPLSSIFFTAGLFAAGALAGRDAHAGRPLHDSAGPYELQVLVDGAPARTFAHAGDTWVLGQLGDRYTLRIVNRSGRRVEAVASVDGRDVMDGKAGDLHKRGYLVPAWGSVDIDGWRLTHAEAAAFRFSSVADSYAARSGAPRDVGVVGVAIFPERQVPQPRPVYVPRYYPQREQPWGDDASGQGYGGGLRGQSAGAPSESGASGAAPSPPSSAPPPPSESTADQARAETTPRAAQTRRPGLGTEFGEAVRSEVHDVEFVRDNAGRPSIVLGVRYNDRDGLLAMGIQVDDIASDAEERGTADPFPVSDRRYAVPPQGWRR